MSYFWYQYLKERHHTSHINAYRGTHSMWGNVYVYVSVGVEFGYPLDKRCAGNGELDGVCLSVEYFSSFFVTAVTVYQYVRRPFV